MKDGDLFARGMMEDDEDDKEADEEDDDQGVVIDEAGTPGDVQAAE